jgi:hypothetical protein
MNHERRNHERGRYRLLNQKEERKEKKEKKREKKKSIEIFFVSFDPFCKCSADAFLFLVPSIF